MARITINHTNFTAGEISPKLYGRTDLARYQDGAKKIRNMIPTIHGGARSRDGTVFVAKARYSDKKARLIRYVFNRDQSYALELGDGYMRFYKDGGQILDSVRGAYQIDSPYTESDIRDVNFAQSGDAMFMAHRQYHPQRLRRFDHAAWILDEAPFVSEPSAESGCILDGDLVLSSASPGTGVAASSVGFIAGDVGRYVTADTGGLAIISAVNSATSATLTIQKAFASKTITRGTWRIEGSPQVTVTNSAASPEGASIYIQSTGTTSVGALVSVSYFYEAVYVSGGLAFYRTRVVTVSPHGLVAGDTILLSGSVADNPSDPSVYNHMYTVSLYVSPTEIELSSGFPANSLSPAISSSSIITSGAIQKQVTTGSSHAFRPSDIGARVKINGGSALITSVNSPIWVTATIESAMTASVAAVKNSWSIEYPVWRSGNYPGAVSIFEQRLLFGGSPSFPNSVWLSVIGEYLNFTPGVNDSDSINLSVASDEVADIRHIAQTKALIALSSGSEYTFFGGVEKPITPTNVQVKNQSVYGCSGVRPQRIGNELYFVQRSGRKLRAMAYKFDSDAYGSPDLSVISEHMTESGIVDMAYQQEPESILWLVRADGALVSVTIDRDQDVIAWAKHDVGGFVESIASIPADARDDLYLIVRRTINGETARYVERMNGLATLDCAVFGTSEAGTDTWSGLDHLEGKTVTVIADGALMNPRVVSGGSITIERPAYSVQIGLPFTPELDLLTPEVGTQSGSSAGSAMRACEISLRIHETKGAKINGDYIPFRRFGSGILDVNAEPFSGICRLENLGWEKGDLPISIEGIPGMPLHVLAAIFKYTSNDG